MIRTRFLRPINYVFVLLALGGGASVILFAEDWNLSGIEQILYISFFISFGLTFILFSRVFPLKKPLRDEKRQLWFVVANGVTFLLFLLFMGFTYLQFSSEDRMMLDPKVIHARIYRVDPEGYRKSRKIYYTFEFEGNRYRGMQSQINPMHRIGDSVRIVFSEGQPEENRVLD